jgi:acid phosphatase type 7
MKKFLSVLIIISSPILYGQVEKKIQIGPYVQNVTTETAVICWSTLANQVKVNHPDGKTDTLNEYEHHEMILANLEPNSTYSYDVLGDGSKDGLGAFTTFPEKVQPFTFAVLGDTRSRHHVQQKIVNFIIKQSPLFVVNTGDLVSDGNHIHDWEKFFEVNHTLFRNTTYFSVLGNHEQDSKHYFDFFNLPGNERYYNFSIGDVLFVMMDTQGPEYEVPDYVKEENNLEFNKRQRKAYFDEQKRWLDNLLTQHRDAGFVFIFFHEPIFSVKKTRVEDAKLRRAYWGDIFERHGVQVILNGHDHHYHHAMAGGTHYITTAGGGAGLYEPDVPQPETLKLAKIEHFVRVDVGLKEAVLTVIDINGDQLDKITVDKRQNK